MFRDAEAASIGSWKMPVSEALIRPLVSAIEARGGVLRTGAAVIGLTAADHGLSGIQVRRACLSRPWYETGELPVGGDVEEIKADAVVSALPVQALSAILDDPLASRAGVKNVRGLQTVRAV